MAETYPPRGLILDLITPLKESGEIDGRGLGRQLDRTLPFVQAILLASPFTGEGKSLNPSQREELLQKVLVVVRGRIPVLVWISQDTEEMTLETLTLLEKGVSRRKYADPVLWVDTPLYYHSNRGLPAFYNGLLSKPGRPLLVYNDPRLIKTLSIPLKRNNIRTAILKEIASIASIKGLIYYGSLDRAGHYQKAVRARADFRIYDGDESRFLNYPSVSGIVSAGANLAPKAWSRVTASSIERHDGSAPYPDHLHQIWETGDYLKNLTGIYQSMTVPLIKKALCDMGVIETPTCTFEADEVGDASNMLRALMLSFGDWEGKA